MNVRIAGMMTKGTSTNVLLPANEMRKSLIITASGGATFVNFSAATAGADGAADIELTDGQSREIQNYVGPCKASGNVRYIEFV